MADGQDSLSTLAAWLGRTLGDSEALFTDFTTEALGTRLPDAVLDVPAVASGLEHGKTAARGIAAAAETLAAATESDRALAFAAYGVALGEYIRALDALVGAVGSGVTPANVPDATARAAAAALVAELPKRLLDLTLAKAIVGRSPSLGFALKLLGLLRWEHIEDTTNALAGSHVRLSLQLERFKDLIDDPERHFRETLGWGANSFDPASFFRIYRRFFGAEDGLILADVDGDPAMRHGGFRIRRDSSVVPPGLEVKFSALPEPIEVRRRLTDEWGVTLATTIELEGGARALLRPPYSVTLEPVLSQPSGELRVFVNRNEQARGFDVVSSDAIGIAVNDAMLGLGVQANWDGVRADVTPRLFAEISGATLRLGSEGADGFVASLLAAAEIEGQFDIGLEWLLDAGLRVKASGGVEIALPIHRSLGPVELNTLYLALRIRDDGGLSLETSAGLTGTLGPITAVVERVGAHIDVRFVDGVDATFGPFDLALGFKPPNGVGLAIDAGVVKGGGYLYFDAERGEYAGALELVFTDVLELSAIGLITTRLPDGARGFSLLVVITADFGTGIQLGYGFVLKTVGGLLGLNRTMRLDALMEAVRTGAIERVLLPTDVVANAQRILSDLRTLFPAADGIFLIGPMAKLGWGTPALITVSLGVIIEIPGNIAIVGVIKVALPTDDAALLVLQVNFAGAIEFDKQRLFFFASLYESRVLFLTIEGEMGLLVAWGTEANFVLSVGGFHPQFLPPPLPFPSPVRISLDLLNQPWGRIRVMGYFAVTASTAQFGARAELYFGFSAFKIEGHLGFDALFQFNPFFFVIEVSAGVSLKAFGVGLFSISLRFSLEGPAPWRAKGYGKISFFFFSIKANFDFTWGEAVPTTLPPIAVMPLLVSEFQKLSNWRAVLPDANTVSVALRVLPSGSAALVLHPLGSLAVSQRAIPLDIPIDKVGTQRPSDANQFTVSVVAGLERIADVAEQFAIGQFKDLSDADKLKSAYQPLNAGCEAAPPGRGFATGRVTKRVVRYETTIIDSRATGFVIRFAGLLSKLFEVFVGGSAVTKTPVSNAAKKRLQPFDTGVEIVAEGYVVAFNRDNTPYSGAAVFASEARAEAFVREQVAGAPALAGSIHVIPKFELKQAA